jgi:hypothetical protein
MMDPVSLSEILAMTEIQQRLVMKSTRAANAKEKRFRDVQTQAPVITIRMPQSMMDPVSLSEILAMMETQQLSVMKSTRAAIAKEKRFRDVQTQAPVITIRMQQLTMDPVS